MKLTPAQRRNLRLYRHYRATPPTFWFLVRQNWRRYVLMMAGLLVIALLGPAGNTISLTWVALGLFAGVLLRDIGNFLLFINVWPATAAVLDWAELERLLDTAESLPNS